MLSATTGLTPRCGPTRSSRAGWLGEALHDYDLELCDLAASNVRIHLQDPDFAGHLKEGLPKGLYRYLQKGRDPKVEQDLLLLGDGELDVLIDALSWCAGREWQPYESLHRWHVHTLREVREPLSEQAAEDWSRACGEFGDALLAKRLPVYEGVEVVRDWVRRLRELLRAAGAVELLPSPEGLSPTPTNETPSAAVGATKRPQESTQPMRGEAAHGSLAGTLNRLADALDRMGVPAAQVPSPEALSKQDAAKFLGVEGKTVEHLIRTRKIQYVQLGSRRGRVIPVDALRKLLQDNTQLTAEEEIRRRARGR